MFDNHLPELIGSALLALGGAAVWLRKMRVGLAQDAAAVAVSESNESAHSAAMTVVHLLRDEVARLSDTNANLATQVVNYQNSTIQMQSEIAILKAKNSRLEEDLTGLKVKLTSIAQAFHVLEDCAQCPYKKIDLNI